MLAPRTTRRVINPTQLLILLCLAAVIWWFHSIATTDRSLRNVHPANATLGYGAIVAVSGTDSPRRDGLIQAANVTGLDIEIPEQPLWTEDDIAGFKNDGSQMGRGSVLAWMAHLHALHWFLDSGLETALIIEDDVDWDIRLRSIQTPLAAQHVRALLPASNPAEHFWGNPNDWDLQYIGHCGDYFNSLQDGVGVGHHMPENLTSRPHAIYHDPTMPDRADLHPFTSSLFTSFRLPEQVRLVHQSAFPLCTFAYALSRAGALKIINEIAPPQEPQREGTHAFDVQILGGCMSGMLRCWSVNPELFHHMEGGSMIAGVEDKPVGRPPVDVAGLEQTYQRLETANIGCGFWTGAFMYDWDDEERLRYLQEEVGRKGKCLKPGREKNADRRRQNLKTQIVAAPSQVS